MSVCLTLPHDEERLPLLIDDSTRRQEVLADVGVGPGHFDADGELTAYTCNDCSQHPLVVAKKCLKYNSPHVINDTPELVL